MSFADYGPDMIADMAAAEDLKRMRKKVRGDRVRVDDVIEVDGRAYVVRAALDIEGKGKVTGISLMLRDVRTGGRRNLNVGAASEVKVISREK